MNADLAPRTGLVRLRVAEVADASVLVDVHASAPACVLTPRPRGASAWACVGSLGGGLVAGDHVDMEIDVEPRARLVVSTQASTKVYRGGAEARQDTRARVGENAVLAFLPDPVTCFTGSRYGQTLRVELAPSASLVCLDWLTAGRSARHERWAFDAYASTTRLFIGDTLRFWDAVRLERAAHPTAMPDRFDVFGTLVLLGPHLENVAQRWLTAAHETPTFRRAELLATTTTLNGGCLVRFAATDVALAQAHLARLTDDLEDIIGASPWQRRPAWPPRATPPLHR